MRIPITDKQVSPLAIYTDVRDGTDKTRALSEYGNAQRLYDLYGEHIRYIPEISGWLVWEGGAWKWDLSGATIRAEAAQLGRRILQESFDFSKHDADYFIKWSRTSQSKRTITSAVSLLADTPSLRLPLSKIDAEIMNVGFNNGKQIIELKSGLVRPAKPEDFITKSLIPNNIGNADKAIKWKLFLNQILNNDVELIDWIKRWCGYLLTGSTSEQIFLFLYGMGANGKSVFAETIRHILGEYGRSVAIETLTDTKRRAGSASPDIVDLIGCRLAVSSELEYGANFAEGFLKSLTGGDTLTTRKLYSENVKFSPNFKLMILGNHKPKINCNSYGMWRRVRLINLTKTFSESERNSNLLEELKAEAEHILSWMIEGCVEWQNKDLSVVPAVITSQTNEYRKEEDVIGQWLEECTLADFSNETDIRLLYKSYQNWAKENGLKEESKRFIGSRLSERGYKTRKSNSKVLYKGIVLSSVDGVNSHT